MTETRKPPWIRSRLPSAGSVAQMNRQTQARRLHTVCKQARCPNLGECTNNGIATFLILGDTCTRNCAFCAVTHGRPLPPDPAEPTSVARAVNSLGLRHAVVTSVTRDDLPDGGSSVFAATVQAVRGLLSCPTVEVLVPDFRGSQRSLEVVVEAGPHVVNHNLETVPRLYPLLRKGADYAQSLAILQRAKRVGPRVFTKSGLMLGMGESRDEVLEVIRDLAEAGCDILTLGQYMRPGISNHPVSRYVIPGEFQELKESAMAEGISIVLSGPMVRSSYRAGDVLEALLARNRGDGPPETIFGTWSHADKRHEKDSIPH